MVENIKSLPTVVSLSREERERGRSIAVEIWAKSKFLLGGKELYSTTLVNSQFFQLTIMNSTYFESSSIKGKLNFDLSISRNRQIKDSKKTGRETGSLIEQFTFNTTDGGYVTKETRSSNEIKVHEASRDELQDLLNDINRIDKIKKAELINEKFRRLIGDFI